jgi:DNA-binding CsgD family transcriptional regulator
MDGNERLTPRQRESLPLLAAGYRSREIAVRLGISIKTVEAHREHLGRRLRVTNVAGLVRDAIRIGLVRA